ncbi:MAG: tyrosine-type recombinase/integrase [Bacteroidetes bacterium]|nr:tyrosine-type recombinase/integrase [Bacteroidota bacterium]
MLEISPKIKQYQGISAYSAIPETNKIQHTLLDTIGHYISQTSLKRVKGFGTVGLSENTVRTYRSLRRTIDLFQKHLGKEILTSEVDKDLVDQLIKWLKWDMAYGDNYSGQIIKLLKIVLKDAEKSGVEIHPYIRYIESFKQKSSERIIHTLTLDEIQKIKNLKNLSNELENTRKWFLIGLHCGQRVSDLLQLSPNQIRFNTYGIYIDFIQQKTEKPVTVGIVDKEVIGILLESFPRPVSIPVFNNQIKELCRLADINAPLLGYITNPKTNRREKITAPKYKFVSTHIIRRSFATNYYGKIETPILMHITGHTKESTFLSYIGTQQNKDAMADLFMQRLGAL